MRFGVSTIERWYYLARSAPDPVAALTRQVRRDRGKQRVMSREVLCALEQQYRAHPGWSKQLHADNLAEKVRQAPERLGERAPSYSTVRRWMRRRGWKRQRQPRHPTPGQRRAAERLDKREVRSFEASHVHGLWHLDFHEARRRVVDAQGAWHTPVVLCILDDLSRLLCHVQWYLAETAENLFHGLSQAILKRGLPRALMHDNGAAMIASEITGGLSRCGINDDPTLAYSPYQNGKQEAFWDTLEGRLMAMVEAVEPLDLGRLNHLTQVWVEQEYHRRVHRELGRTPLEAYLAGPSVGREAPAFEELRRRFTHQVGRTQRHTDATISLDGVRFELPNRLRTLNEVTVRYQRWDLSEAWVIDPRTEKVIARIQPQDKQRNADRRRRSLEPVADDAPPAAEGVSEALPPLMQRYLAEYAATGLPPAYLPKDELPKREEEDDA